jgi:hypothetical protein
MPDQQESFTGTTYQNRNIPAVDKDVEAVVSNILSSKFPEVQKSNLSVYCLLCFTLELCGDR